MGIASRWSPATTSRRRVPPAPGWTVREVVTHVAEVYEQKIACTLLQREEPSPPRWPAERDPLEWFADVHQRLLDLFTNRGAEESSYTWWPADQTVGFWARRMAQETVIHRVDAELSSGQSSPVDPELAVDGVDEVLTIFLAGAAEPVREAVPVSAPRGDADAELSGDPEPVLPWLWGRGSASRLTRAGDAAVLTLLRDRLPLATQ
ncbi:MAG TPA: maleylpyruvate isomerase family mycothiol-dependent enzyme [Candidatus Acidoferrales bacterium]|nr:maleylpyruvate isomerase family mycothiol-dependent enzyme [Candidatus Acidoferrales bacterium]